jgi:hypothetical protein
MADERFAPPPATGIPPTPLPPATPPTLAAGSTATPQQTWVWLAALGAFVAGAVVMYGLMTPAGAPPAAPGRSPGPVTPVKSVGAPALQDAPRFKPAPVPAAENRPTVYITRTGTHYHRAGCQYLRQSCIPVSLKEAVERGEIPCSRCRPPTLDELR